MQDHIEILDAVEHELRDKTRPNSFARDLATIMRGEATRTAIVKLFFRSSDNHQADWWVRVRQVHNNKIEVIVNDPLEYGDIRFDQNEVFEIEPRHIARIHL